MHTRASFSAYGLSAAVVRPKGQGGISFSSSFSLGLLRGVNMKPTLFRRSTYMIDALSIRSCWVRIMTIKTPQILGLLGYYEEF